MYRKTVEPALGAENFELPVGGKLVLDNRWVIMAGVIPWSEYEEEYAKNFTVEIGAPAKPFRMALGALIIKDKLGISDRETVEQIKENPYLQYFIGLNRYSNEAPFEASMLVHFRDRLNVELVKRMNRNIFGTENGEKEEAEKKLSEAGKEQESKNKGQLILDATCAPADLKYPTDVGLLNQARERTEKIIDIFYKKIEEGKPKDKPTTYRREARKEYLNFSKKRKTTKKQRRKAVKKQLQYVKRNLGHIEGLYQSGAKLEWLSEQQYKTLLVIAEIYRQQLWMYENKSNRIDDRIVSLTQPHVRPIVRGKAGHPVEFGAKISASYYNGYIFLDRISWDNFNESGDLKAQVEEFKLQTGDYPKSVHVDKIYRSRENRAWCKERGIRLSGVPLGRPPKNISQETKKQAIEDERVRNRIEGKFGEAKRRYSLNLVTSKLPNTSETSIAISFFVMNLMARVRQISLPFFMSIFRINAIFLAIQAQMISKNYHRIQSTQFS